MPIRATHLRIKLLQGALVCDWGFVEISSVIVLKVHVDGVFANKLICNSPITSERYCELTYSITFQNPKDILTSTDPDMAGSYAAIQRAAQSTEELAIQTNTNILVPIDGKDVELTEKDLLNMRAKNNTRSTQ